jgi:hypothetical protein
MTQGLHDKYIVTKVDGSPVDPEAQYFVLRLDTDPSARLALRTYITQCAYKRPQLALDLKHWLRDIVLKLQEGD